MPLPNPARVVARLLANLPRRRMPRGLRRRHHARQVGLYLGHTTAAQRDVYVDFTPRTEPTETWAQHLERQRARYGEFTTANDWREHPATRTYRSADVPPGRLVGAAPVDLHELSEGCIAVAYSDLDHQVGTRLHELTERYTRAGVLDPNVRQAVNRELPPLQPHPHMVDLAAARKVVADLREQGQHFSERNDPGLRHGWELALDAADEALQGLA